MEDCYIGKYKYGWYLKKQVVSEIGNGYNRTGGRAMCGRYYVDDETLKEIERIVRHLEGRLPAYGKGKDIYPSGEAAVLFEKTEELAAGVMNWGFPGYEGSRLIINGRAEGAMEKRTFRENLLHRRCIIPAKGFYEWNRQKEKNSFYTEDGAPLFMAGCYGFFGEERRFVILTTKANPSVSCVHERMPLILKRDEIENWILNDSAVEDFLKKTPPMLARSQEYEQMSLF